MSLFQCVYEIDWNAYRGFSASALRFVLSFLSQLPDLTLNQFNRKDFALKYIVDFLLPVNLYGIRLFLGEKWQIVQQIELLKQIVHVFLSCLFISRLFHWENIQLWYVKCLNITIHQAKSHEKWSTQRRISKLFRCWDRIFIEKQFDDISKWARKQQVWHYGLSMFILFGKIGTYSTIVTLCCE